MAIFRPDSAAFWPYFKGLLVWQNVAPLTVRSIFSDGLASKRAPPLAPGCVLLAVNADEVLNFRLQIREIWPGLGQI